MEEERVVEEPKKEKKKRKRLLKILTFLIVLAFIAVALGFIFPGLLWTKNLGVRYTEEDYKSMLYKLNYIKDETPTLDSADLYTYKYGELKSINVEFTSEELTAFFNENRPNYYALKNVQIKINSDGTIEASANANVDYFLNEFLSGKYSKEDIKNQIPALGLLLNTVNLNIKFNGEVINNKTNVNISNIQVQGVTIPSDLINSNDAKNIVNDGCNSIINTYNGKTGSTFKSISIEDSKVKFEGSVPSSIERIEK